MDRDLKKYIKKYHTSKRYKDDKTGRGCFNGTDIIQLMQISSNEGCYDFNNRKPDTVKELLFCAVLNGLDAGFVIGYESAMRDIKRRAEK